jgi:triacylglycerol esterase/lipase EstA (alpha/beta hydrolase family)
MLKLLTPLLLLSMAMAAAPANAAPPARDDGMTEPVYLVHGYSADGTDCQQRWGPAMEAWRKAGWEGGFHTVGYYEGDSSCNTKIAAANRSTPIQQLGSQLAWDIYLQYSRHGRSVDVVGHSMGGLIARVALTGVSRGWDGFPPFVYVEDAVTLGTPHGGVSASWVRSCDETQCVQMRPGSKFLRVLASVGQNPQSNQGTDWTLIGSEDDATVAWQSAVASRAAPSMRPGHPVLYRRGEGIGHGDLASTVSGDHMDRLSYSRGNGPVQRTGKGRSPVYAAGGAIKWWSRW